MASLSSQSYVFDPRPNYPLLTTVKRYWKPSSISLDDPEALTLVCTHGTGFHKEHWEPAIEDLYELFEKLGDRTRVKIREVWSIDAPNHGDAAIENEEALKWGYEPIFPWEEYGRSVHAFLAGLGTGVDVDFRARRLVGIGHSMGAVAFLLSMSFQPTINFTALHLVEPLILTRAAKAKLVLEDSAIKRRDIWPSPQAALKALASRPAWKSWDERVLRKYVECGLRALPTGDYPDIADGVTLKCTRRQEAASYRDRLGRSRAFLLIPDVVKRWPIHLIYGEIFDYLQKEIKEEIIYRHSGGIDKWASVAWVKGAGHLMVQTHPRLLAEKIRDALLLTPPERDPRARL